MNWRTRLAVAISSMLLIGGAAVTWAQTFNDKHPWMGPTDCERHYLASDKTHYIYVRPGDWYLLYTTADWYDLLEISTLKYFVTEDWRIIPLPGFTADWLITDLYAGQEDWMTDNYPKYAFAANGGPHYAPSWGGRISLDLPVDDPNVGIVYDLCRSEEHHTPTPIPPEQTQSAIPTSPVTATQQVSPTATCDPTGPTNTPVPVDSGCYTLDSELATYYKWYTGWTQSDYQALLPDSFPLADSIPAPYANLHASDPAIYFDMPDGEWTIRLIDGSSYALIIRLCHNSSPTSCVVYEWGGALTILRDKFYLVRDSHRNSAPFSVEICDGSPPSTNTPEPLCTGTPEITATATITPEVHCVEASSAPGGTSSFWVPYGWVEWVSGSPIEVENYGSRTRLSEPAPEQAPVEGDFTVTNRGNQIAVYRVCPGDEVTPYPTTTPSDTPTGTWETPTPTGTITPTNTPTIDPSGTQQPPPTPQLPCGGAEYYDRNILVPCVNGIFENVYLNDGAIFRLSGAAAWSSTPGLTRTLNAGIHTWDWVGDGGGYVSFCALGEKPVFIDICAEDDGPIPSSPTQPPPPTQPPYPTQIPPFTQIPYPTQPSPGTFEPGPTSDVVPGWGNVPTIEVPAGNSSPMPDIGLVMPTIIAFGPTTIATTTIEAMTTQVRGEIQKLKTPASLVLSMTDRFSYEEGQRIGESVVISAAPVLEWMAILNPYNPAWDVECGPLWALAPVLLPLLPIILLSFQVVLVKFILWIVKWILAIINLIFKLIEAIPGE